MSLVGVLGRLGLCSIVAALVAGAAQAAPASTLPTTGFLKLYQSHDRVLVMMRIDGGEPLPMVFDTGSDGNSIDRRLVRRYRMKRIGQSIEVDGTTGKQRSLPFVEARGVSLGGLDVGKLQAAALDYDYSDAAGIVSSEIFTGSLVYVELGKSRARLEPRTGGALKDADATPYVAGIATIDIRMPDGSTLPAHFDTGYNAPLSLPIALMNKVPLMAPPQVVGRFKSINTEGEVYGGRIKGSIRIGPVVLENPEVSFLGDLANIGLPVIRQVTLVLDPSQKRSWVLPLKD